MKRLVMRELMDDDERVGTIADWRISLDDLARVNAWLGGTSVILKEVGRLGKLPKRVLDVATGGADVPLALLDDLRHAGVEASCTAVDRSERLLRLAAERVGGRTDISLCRADARALPFGDASFDLATFNLALHHFDPDDAVVVLRELARVARVVIVNDLRRSVVAWIFALTGLRLMVRSALTKADGPVSVRRSYTPREMLELARRAGWKTVAVRKHLWYRAALVGAAS